MKYLYSAVYEPNKKLTYRFNKEKETVNVELYNKVTEERQADTFDFSILKEGDEVFFLEDECRLDIETTLPFLPIDSARRVNGKIEVKLRYFYGGEDEKEPTSPEWREVR